MKLMMKSSGSGGKVCESLKVRVEWFCKCEFIDGVRSSLTPLCPLHRKSCTPWRWPTTYSASCAPPAKRPSGTRPSTWRRESPTAREVSDSHARPHILSTAPAESRARAPAVFNHSNAATSLQTSNLLHTGPEHWLGALLRTFMLENLL